MEHPGVTFASEWLHAVGSSLCLETEATLGSILMAYKNPFSSSADVTKRIQLKSTKRFMTERQTDRP